jgi:hypothetical protein
LSIWWIIPTYFALSGIQKSLQKSAQTETPYLLNRHSSFAEVFRGLGLWALYEGYAGKPYCSWFINYFETQPFLIFISFVAPFISFLSMIFIRKLNRDETKLCLFFAALAIIAIPLSVGAYPPNNPSIFGKFFLWAYYNLPFFNAFKSTYKFSIWLFLSYAVLITASLRYIQHVLIFPKIKKFSVILLITILILPNSFIFLKGLIYEKDSVVSSFPDYWLEASEWINNDSGDFRVLMYPSSPHGYYKWGTTRGEIQLALLHKPQITLFSGFLGYTEEGDKLVRRIYELLSQNNTQIAMVLGSLVNLKYVISSLDFNENRTKIRESDLYSIFSSIPKVIAFDDTITIYENPYFEDRYIYAVENPSIGDIDRLITYIGNGIYAQYDTVTYSWLEDMSYLDVNLSDFEACFSVKLRTQGHAALNFVTSDGKYYSFQIRTDESRIEKSKEGKRQISINMGVRAQPNKWYNVCAQKKNDTLMLMVDSEMAALAIDNEFKYGYVGLSTCNTTAYFDNLTIKDLTTGREIINENFDSYPFGQSPSTWNIYDNERSKWRIGIDNEQNLSITVDKIFGRKLPFVTAYQKINPTLWKVQVNATKPFMLSFAESYDPLWEARVYKDGKLVEKVKPIPVYGVINGFWISTTGDNLEIVIRYKPQDWFEIGLVISGITFASCLFYLFYDWRRSKRDKWAIKLESKLKNIKFVRFLSFISYS